MMFTPCWPSAGPTGGEGFAFPAGSCSFTIPVTFFIASLLRLSWSSGRCRPPTVHCKTSIIRITESGLLHLHEVELHRRRAPEDADQHADAALVGVHFLDGAV